MLKRITSLVLAVVMVMSLVVVSPTKANAAVKFYYGKKLTLTVGETDNIYVKGKGAKFTSSNKKIATVSKKGKVKAKKVGTCKITVKQGGSTAKATITVKPATVKNVKAKLASTNSAKITWSSVKGATGYYVYASTKKNSGFKKKATVKGGSKKSTTIKNLSLGSYHYFKVKAYAKVGKKTVTSTSYSKVASVKTWKMVWNDEFEGATLDLTKWNNDGATGAGGYGNNELQDYQMEYSKVTGGNLVIMPQIKMKNGNYVANSAYSTKLWTKGQFDFTYGKVEFRVKLPKAQGTWAAAWMLGNSENYGGWPMCGEIDILETTPESTKTKIPQSIHNNRFNGMPTSPGNKYKTQTISTATTAFHTYGIEWFADRIVFTIDGKETWTYNPNDYKASGSGGTQDQEIWPFNKPFYLILNCAIGGTLGGQPTSYGWTPIHTAADGTITYQDYYYIDWVRVYK